MTLGRVDRLLPSGVDSVKESESLLPMSPGSQSFVTMPHVSNFGINELKNN